MIDSADRLEILRPDDWHVHLRDNEALLTTVPDQARTFGRAIVMPNLKPPIIKPADASAYKKRILAARPNRSDFEPLMTLYLSDTMSPTDIDLALEDGHVHAVKYYPAGATTNSEAGVTALDPVKKNIQIDIFSQEKNENLILEQALDNISDKFGPNAIKPARLMSDDKDSPDVIAPAWMPAGYRKSV